MASAPMVLVQSIIAEGDKLFSAILAHLRRLYLEVCSTAVSLGKAPARRESPIGEHGEGLSGGSIHIISKLGAYAGIFDSLNHSIAIMNNPIPIIPYVYLDTPPVCPTPEPL